MEKYLETSVNPSHYKKLPKWFSFGLVIIVILVIYFIASEGTYKKDNVTNESIGICQVDSECVAVPYDGCCTFKTAINKKYLNEYNRNPEFNSDINSKISCSLVECNTPEPLLEGDTAMCVNQRCQVKNYVSD